MKKNILLFLCLLSIQTFAQYSSPGNNGSYTLDDLVAISDGAVTLGDNQYYFNEDITISTNDTMKIISNENLEIGEGLLWTIEGVLITDAPELCTINKKSDENNFLGIRFDNSSSSSLKNTAISNGGGIKLIDSNIEMASCTIQFMNTEYSSSALSLSSSNPIIRNCKFQLNQGPGIGSAANASSSPQIINNEFYLNVTSNGNTPQINLGTSNGFNPILIENNEIRGAHDNAGGIAISTLAGGSAQVLIKDNFIMDNRYGIAIIGNNLSGRIEYNTIVANTIQNDPMLGGSGINFNGGETNSMIVKRNIIAYNLWGITIQGDAQPNLGDGTDNSPGHNRFEGNGNNDIIYALYNNTPNDIMALNNYWNTETLEETEEVIYHVVDDLSLGEVFYDPLWTNPVGLGNELPESRSLISPNPTNSHFKISIEEECQINIYLLSGQLFKSFSILPHQNINISDWKKGTYILQLHSKNENKTEKLLVF